MAHTVMLKDFDDVMVRWSYLKNRRRAELVAIDPVTGLVTSKRISVSVAEMLIEHGMASGD